MEFSVVTFLLLLFLLALAFANGTNDVSKAIATLVGSGVTRYRTAILWGTVWTIIGAGMSGLAASAMVKTFSTGLIEPGMNISPHLALGVMVGAMAWVLLASRIGLPVSTTHALTGAIIGAGLAAWSAQGLLWSALVGKIVLPLAVSPALALTLSFFFHPVLRAVAIRWEGTCVCVMPSYRALVAVDGQGGTRILFQAVGFGRAITDVPTQCDRAGLRGLTLGLDSIHWLSSGLASFARGMNDAPKIAAMLLLGLSMATWPSAAVETAVFLGIAMAIAAGSIVGGLRVTEVLAEKVTRMDHVEGLSANLTTSSLVLVSATLGLPVSTTHVSSSAIIGIGLLRGMKAVRWNTVRDMVLAWIVTIPVAGILASLSYLLLVRLL